jgi:hypothetical protein
MPTKVMQRNEVPTTTFKDEALEVAVILHWMKRACVYFSKVWDNESIRNLIFALNLTMEYIVLNTSKRLKLEYF